MLRFRGKTLLFLTGLLCAMLCMTVCAFAVADDEIAVDWNEEEGLLKVECGAEVTSLPSPTKWTDFDSATMTGKVRTVWLSGENVTTIDSNSWTSLNNGATVCVVIDMPSLNDCGKSRMCNCATNVFYVQGEENLFTMIKKSFGSSSTGVTTYTELANIGELCKVTVQEMDAERGKVVTTVTSPYVKSGTETAVSAIPVDGYRISEILMNGTQISLDQGVVIAIESDAVFSAECAEDDRVIIDSGVNNESNPSMKWTLFEGGELEFVGAGNMPASWTAWSGHKGEITSITITNGITGIADSAFNDSNKGYKVEKVVIGDDVKTIGKSAFANLTALTEVSIGTGLTGIGNTAFSSCKSLRRMDFYGDKPTTVGTSLCPNSAPGTFLIVYHKQDGGWGDYLKDASGISYLAVYADEEISEFSILTKWEDDTLRNNQGVIFTLSGNTARVGADQTSQRNNAGYYGINGRDGKSGYVVIPDSVSYNGQAYNVTAIQTNAFSDNYFVKEVEIGKNIRDVAVGSFYNCPCFTDFHLHIENQSFYVLDGILYNSNLSTLCIVPGNKQFTSYEIPSVVTTIREGAFQGCLGIQEVEIFSGVSTIQDNAFLNAAGLIKFYAEGGVRNIGNTVFSGCTGLEEVYIYSGVETIGTKPFYNCTAMRRLTLPFLGTNKSTGSTVFSLFGGSKFNDAKVPQVLNRVTISGGKLKDSAFLDYASLQSVHLGSEITAISASCFSGCTALTDLRIGETSTSGKGFVQIPGYIESIGATAFKACPFTRFYVEESNKKYASDYWGALYGAVNTGNANTINKYETLICYPPNAEHWYYCVKSVAASVQDYAFLRCYNLLTVNIPGLKTTISTKAYGNETIHPQFWVHDQSNALSGLGGATNAAVFESGNENQAMGILNMPDRLTFEADGDMPEFQNLFFYVRITGATILLDNEDYELTCPDLGPGPRTATATFKLKDEDGNILTTSFDFYLLERDEERSIVEYRLKSDLAVKKPDKLTGYASLYSFEGQTLDISEAVYIDNTESNKDLRCAAYVPTALLGGEAGRLSVFTLKNGTTPHTEASLDLWLSAPTELKWGEGYQTGENAVNSKPKDRAGEISWKTDEKVYNQYYRWTVYQKTEDEDIAVWNNWKWNSDLLRVDGSYREFQEFPLSIYEKGDGTYYFETTALTDSIGSTLLEQTGDLAYEETHYYNSSTVTSGEFAYEKPETQLEPPVSTESNPMDWIMEDDVPVSLSWKEPKGATAGGYTIRIYFCRWVKNSGWANSRPRQIGEQTFFKDTGEFNEAAIREFVARCIRIQNKDKAGYYAYTITAETPNVKEAVRSVESEISTPRYYVGG